MSQPAEVTVRRANLPDLPGLTELFDGYRQFYGQPSDPTAVRNFLSERLKEEDSVILVAVEGRTLLGFTQLYPSFTSVGLGRIYVLNDLFVAEAHRHKGAARALLAQAVVVAQKQNCRKLQLSTGVTNATAQRLYEAAGWKRDSNYFTYVLGLS